MSETQLDEILLGPCQPSQADRRDAALAKGGVAPGEIGATKDALAAVGLAGAPAASAASAPPSLRDRLLASVSRPGRHGRWADRLARMFDLTIPAAEALAAKLDDPAAYNAFFIPGVEVIQVEPGPRYPGAIGVIAKIQPGTTFPDHVHRGEETMFVLAGGFREQGENGHEVWRGDELVSADGSDHAFVALEGEPCIAASLVVGVVEFR